MDSRLGTPFWVRSPKPEWSREMIIASLCVLGNRLYLAHYFGGLSIWDITRQVCLGTLTIDGSGHWKLGDEEGQGENPSRLWQQLHA